jgi:site-specific DNA-cytosine methylase
MKPVSIDVFCGAGGMTDGMLAAGFDVYGVDIVRRPEYRGNLAECDVRHAIPIPELKPVWVHGSPPCQRFSTARASKAWDPPTAADLDLLEAFLRFRDGCRPQFWSVENVRGSLSWFSRLLGPPVFKNGPYVFWGNFPPFLVGKSNHRKGASKRMRDGAGTVQWATNTRDPWLRARLPESITVPMAQAVMAAVRPLETVGNLEKTA